MKENPRGTWVFKSRVSLLHHRNLLSSSSILRANLKTPIVQHSSSPLRVCSSLSDPIVQHSSSPLRLCSSSSDRSSLYSSSSDLLFFKSAVLQVPSPSVLCHQIYYSSSLLFFKFQICCFSSSKIEYLVLLFRTWVYKTRDLCGIILPTHQVGIESLILEF